MLSTSSINYEKKIFLTTILVRLFFLILVVLLSAYMEKGFIASHRDVDDWRYEEGGFYYSQNATSLIDSNTFTEAYGRMNDNTGYNLYRPFYSMYNHVHDKNILDSKNFKYNNCGNVISSYL